MKFFLNSLDLELWPATQCLDVSSCAPQVSASVVNSMLSPTHFSAVTFPPQVQFFLEGPTPTSVSPEQWDFYELHAFTFCPTSLQIDLAKPWENIPRMWASRDFLFCLQNLGHSSSVYLDCSLMLSRSGFMF